MVNQDPHLDGDTLSCSIKLLDGTVPAATVDAAGDHRCSSAPGHRAAKAQSLS